jgi:hypothetical protein
MIGHDRVLDNGGTSIAMTGGKPGRQTAQDFHKPQHRKFTKWLWAKRLLLKSF